MIHVDPITHLPSSDATNGYDLLTDVCQAILDEPKRLDMSNWIAVGKFAEFAEKRENMRPSCGTLACIAGWTVLLRRNDRALESFRDSEIADTAINLLLGPESTLRYASEQDEDCYRPTDESEEEWRAFRTIVQRLNNLFTATSPHVITNAQGIDFVPERGTQAYAEDFVARVRAFQEQYAEVLRARTL